jgi:hypothetical protein
VRRPRVNPPTGGFRGCPEVNSVSRDIISIATWKHNGGTPVRALEGSGEKP